MTHTLSAEHAFYTWPAARGKAPTPILSDVHFSFEAKGVLAILGPNGAGKTTLLRSVLGLLPWTKGRSLLDGRDVRDWAPRDFWRIVGYVPQAKSPAFTPMTIRDMVALGRSPHLGPFGRPGPKDWEIVDRVLEEVGVPDLAHRLTSEVSGGQLQLALIARALATEPALLVLDEPESNLDFRNQRVVLDVIQQLADRGLGCILNTHFPAHALALATKTLLVPKGEPPVFGDTKDLMTEENLSRLFSIPVRIRTLHFDEGDVPCVTAL